MLTENGQVSEWICGSLAHSTHITNIDREIDILIYKTLHILGLFRLAFMSPPFLRRNHNKFPLRDGRQGLIYMAEHLSTCEPAASSTDDMAILLNTVPNVSNRLSADHFAVSRVLPARAPCL
jgi:hypothetical protein